MGTARVEMEGFVLPVVNEVTCAQSHELFVPLDRKYKEVADCDVSFSDDGTLDSLCLSISAYGPELSDVERRKHEVHYHKIFSKRFLEEQRRAHVGSVRGVGYAFDALGVAPLVVTFGTSVYHAFPDIATYVLLVPTFQATAAVVALGYSAIKEIVGAQLRQRSANFADHFSTNTTVSQGLDMELHEKIIKLHAYYDSFDDIAENLNERMAKKADELGLPASISRFYIKRNERDPGTLYEGLDTGIVRTGANKIKRGFRDELGMFIKMGKRFGRVAQQKESCVSIPVTLLPTMLGYEALVGYTGDDDLDHLAMRLGRGDDVELCSEVFAPEDISDKVKETLERELPNVIHDNMYCETRGWHVIPAEVYKKTEKWGRIASYVGGTIGIGLGVSAILFGAAPIAGACFALSSAYLLARATFLSKRLANASIAPHKTAVEGHDKLQDMLKEGVPTRYHVDPTLHRFVQIISSQECAHEAYVLCAGEAIDMDRRDLAAAYIIKAESVEPIRREEQVGLLEIER